MAPPVAATGDIAAGGAAAAVGGAAAVGETATVVAGAAAAAGDIAGGATGGDAIGAGAGAGAGDAGRSAWTAGAPCGEMATVPPRPPPAGAGTAFIPCGGVCGENGFGATPRGSSAPHPRQNL